MKRLTGIYGLLKNCNNIYVIDTVFFFQLMPQRLELVILRWLWDVPRMAWGYPTCWKLQIAVGSSGYSSHQERIAIDTRLMSHLMMKRFLVRKHLSPAMIISNCVCLLSGHCWDYDTDAFPYLSSDCESYKNYVPIDFIYKWVRDHFTWIKEYQDNYHSNGS